MSRFFKKNGIISNTRQWMTGLPRKVSTCSQHFELEKERQFSGKLIKILVSEADEKPETVVNYLRKKIVKENPNSLFVWTTPTSRLNGQHGEFIYPGHNFSSITDKEGETVSFLSKRPDTKAVLGERRRIPDNRFTNSNLTTKLFRPHFTTVEEEIEKWVNRALLVPAYPLYVHVIPLVNGVELDIDTYKDNVKQIMEMEEPYTLYSWAHPNADHYIPASNCNSATEQSIFGPGAVSVHDLYCQEAAMKIVSRFLKLNKQSGYLHYSELLGLANGIEPSTIPEERYRCAFTC